jgi:hypothetical protein
VDIARILILADEGDSFQVWRVAARRVHKQSGTASVRPIGRPMLRWEYNIRMDLKEIRWESVDLIHVTQDWDRWQALVNTVMNLRVAYGEGGFLG